MTMEEVAALWQSTPQSLITASEDIIQACDDLKKYSAYIADAEAKAAALKNRITVYMLDNEMLLSGNGDVLATFKTSRNGQRRFLLKAK